MTAPQPPPEPRWLEAARTDALPEDGPRRSTPIGSASNAWRVTPVARAGTAAPARAGATPLSLLAGLCVAIVGGLMWAAVVIATRFDFGLLALVVGAATGGAVYHVAGRGARPAGRALAGLFAAGGIVLGKYVIWVHEVKAALGPQIAADGGTIGYLHGRELSVFVDNIGTILHPIYAVWIAFAFVAAFRTAGRGRIFPQRR
jgi:hypothetical protein